MFDKITLKAKLTADECEAMAHNHRLKMWVNESNTVREFRSDSYANITGMSIKIDSRGQMTMKASLHKYWNKNVEGIMRNDNDFTLNESLLAFKMLLSENNLEPEKTRITQFEIGVNLNVENDPKEYIQRCLHINSPEKNMFVDANYRVNRQRTTMKHKDMRKYFKIYDKGWEMIDRRKVKREDRANILRIETIYRRHNEKMVTFATLENFRRLASRFKSDWSTLFFERKVVADIGTRKSELDRAKEILNIGIEAYVEKMREKHEDGKITYRQFRTCRDFARDFELHGHRFKSIISTYEAEYQQKLTEIVLHDLA